MLRFLYSGICFLILTSLMFSDAKLDYNVIYSQKAQKIVDIIIGESKSVVSVDIALENPTWALDFSGNNDKSKEYLPGYSGIKQSGGFPDLGLVKGLPTTIKKITIQIIVDKRISKRNMKQVSEVLNQFLSLNASRGDSIEISYQNFPKPMAADDFLPEQQSGGLQQVMLMIFGLLLVVFIGLYGFFEFKKFTKKPAPVASSGGGGGGSRSSAQSGSQAASQVKLSSNSISDYFSYIDASNIHIVSHIFEDKKWPIKDVCVVLSKLPTSAVREFLKMFSDDKKQELVQTFLDNQAVSLANLKKIDETLKKELDSLVGGTDITKSILESFDHADLEKLFVKLKSNPKSYERLRPIVFLFEDLLRVEDKDLKRLLGQLDFDDLGKIMTSLKDQSKKEGSEEAESIYSKLLDNLSQASQDLISQQVDLKSGKYEPEEINLAIQHFFDLIIVEQELGHIHFIQGDR